MMMTKRQNKISPYLNKTMANVWLAFLAQWRKSHPKVSMKQAMKSAAVEYRKKKGGTKKKKTKKDKRKLKASRGMTNGA